MRFSERSFRALDSMDKFTVDIYFPTEGLTLSDQSLRLQDRKFVRVEV